MMRKFSNPEIVQRFDELIERGNELWWDPIKNQAHKNQNPVLFTQWTTSSLNLLDKLSISTNRFVREFEKYSSAQTGQANIGLALGVLQAARDEYIRGLAVDYQLGVSAAVFGDIISEARYLLEKGYLRASAILARAGLEETLRARARAIPIDISNRVKLFDLLGKLRHNGILTEFDERRIDAYVKIGNAAAHGDAFSYNSDDVKGLVNEAEQCVINYLDAK